MRYDSDFCADSADEVDISRDVSMSDDRTWAQVVWLMNMSEYENKSYNLYYNDPELSAPVYGDVVNLTASLGVNASTYNLTFNPDGGAASDVWDSSGNPIDRSTADLSQFPGAVHRDGGGGYEDIFAQWQNDDTCSIVADGFVHARVNCIADEDAGVSEDIWYFPDRSQIDYVFSENGGNYTIVSFGNEGSAANLYYTTAGGDQINSNPGDVYLTRGYYVDDQASRIVVVFNISQYDGLIHGNNGFFDHRTIGGVGGGVTRTIEGPVNFTVLYVVTGDAASNQLGKDWETIYQNPLQDQVTIGGEVLL